MSLADRLAWVVAAIMLVAWLATGKGIVGQVEWFVAEVAGPLWDQVWVAFMGRTL